MTTFSHSSFNHIKDWIFKHQSKYLQAPAKHWSCKPCLFLYAIKNVWHHTCSRCWIHCHCILILGHPFLQIAALSIKKTFDLYLSVCEMPWNRRWTSNYLMGSLVFDAISNTKDFRRGKCALHCLLDLKSIVFVNYSMRRFPSVKTVWWRDSHCYRSVYRELHSQGISSTQAENTNIKWCMGYLKAWGFCVESSPSASTAGKRFSIIVSAVSPEELKANNVANNIDIQKSFSV